MLTPRLAHAINLATVLHDGHYRKASGIPYTSHLCSVMHLLYEHGANEDLLIASLLHDVIEDQSDRYSFADMTEDFGPRVTGLVKDVTKNSSLPSWQARADDYLARLADASAEAVLLCLADKYHNLLSILMDHQVVGEAVWQRFNSGKQRQIWWYRSVAELAAARLPGHSLTKQYGDLVQQLGAI